MVDSITFLLLWFISLKQSFHLLHHKLVQGWTGLNQLSQHVTRRSLLGVSGKEKQVLVSYVIYEQKSMWFQFAVGYHLMTMRKTSFWMKPILYMEEWKSRKEWTTGGISESLSQPNLKSVLSLWTSWNNRRIFFLSQFEVRPLKTYKRL